MQIKSGQYSNQANYGDDVPENRSVSSYKDMK